MNAVGEKSHSRCIAISWEAVDDQYELGNEVLWHGFTSCSRRFDLAYLLACRTVAARTGSYDFDDAEQIVNFKIDVHSGYDVAALSASPDEQEIMLLPGVELMVAGLPALTVQVPMSVSPNSWDPPRDALGIILGLPRGGAPPRISVALLRVDSPR